MQRSISALVLLLSASTVYAQAKEHAPVGLPYAHRMSHESGESWTYVKPAVDLRKYRTIIIEPTALYNGADAQFDDVTMADREKYADLITHELRGEIAKSFPAVSRPGPDTARLRITLLGVDTTTGGVATATRVMPIGFAINAVKSIAGKPGRMTGSILYAAELTDGTSNELQVAAVRRRSPDALDIPATLSTSDTVKAVARDLAEDLRKKLASAAGRPE
jgi:hypothetical protein